MGSWWTLEENHWFNDVVDQAVRRPPSSDMRSSGKWQTHTTVLQQGCSHAYAPGEEGQKVRLTLNNLPEVALDEVSHCQSPSTIITLMRHNCALTMKPRACSHAFASHTRGKVSTTAQDAVTPMQHIRQVRLPQPTLTTLTR